MPTNRYDTIRSGSDTVAFPEVAESHTNNTHVNNTKENGSRNVVFDNPDLQHGFTQVPNVVLEDRTLGMSAKVCYILLLSYAWQARECFPTQYLLSQEMGCSERTVIRTMKELVKRKLIKIERRGLNKSNIYHIRKFTDGYIPRQCVDRGHH